MQKATDEPFAKEIIAKCKESVYILPASSDINSTILSLTNADIVIAMRCHAAILSASQGIPVVGIVYHHKVSEFLRSIGLIDFAEEIGDGINWRESDINTNNLVSNINNLITNYADICHIMNHHIESLKNSEKQNIFCLSKLL
jgi:polysaccharide pyruvyl transferase WcaK-like protein